MNNNKIMALLATISMFLASAQEDRREILAALHDYHQLNAPCYMSEKGLFDTDLLAQDIVLIEEHAQYTLQRIGKANGFVSTKLMPASLFIGKYASMGASLFGLCGAMDAIQKLVDAWYGPVGMEIEKKVMIKHAQNIESLLKDKNLFNVQEQLIKSLMRLSFVERITKKIEMFSDGKYRNTYQALNVANFSENFLLPLAIAIIAGFAAKKLYTMTNNRKTSQQWLIQDLHYQWETDQVIMAQLKEIRYQQLTSKSTSK